MTSLTRIVRNLGRDPGFSLLALLTLTLGLTATLSIFTLVNGVLLRQLPFPEAERLVNLDHTAPALNLDNMGTSSGLYFHYLDRSHVFEELGLYNQSEETITGQGEPERVTAISATPSVFRALAVAPQLGRLFSEADGEPGAPDVVLLGDALWRSRYGADPSVVGRTVAIKGVPHEVVGVMPPGFRYPEDTQLWLVRQVDRSTAQLGSFNDSAIGRLRPGVSVEGAREELTALVQGLEEAFPDERAAPVMLQAGFRPLVETELEAVVGSVRGVLWVLLGTVGVILLIACANVANLFLVRVEERANELAVRTALGASRWRLLGQQVAEGIALALVAGAVSVALAAVAVVLVKSHGPADIPRLDSIGLDARVLVFALVLSVVTGALLGALAALRGTGGSLTVALKEGGRSSTVGKERHRLRNVLVASQVALGLVLLVGCGLLLRSLERMSHVDPGFVAEERLTFGVSVPRVEYPSGEDRARFAERLIERLEALPGVSEAGVVSYLPLTGTASGAGYAVEGEDIEEAVPRVFMHANASPGYFEAMGMRLLEGRTFEPADHRQRSRNVVVTETLARSLWPEESALGRRIVQGTPEGPDDWYTIVGVVNELRIGGLEDDPTPMVFKPLLGIATEDEADPDDIGLGMSVVLRTEVPPASLASAVRAEVWSLDPSLPITRLMPLREILRDAQARMSFTVAVLGIAAVMALLIAAVGLYGVISYVVSRRRHEIGVRMALGASRRSVGRLVLRQGLVVGGVGIVVGLGLAVAASRLFESMLFGVGILDPLTFLLVPLVLLAVVLFASWLPARRATRVDPLVALRHD